MKINSSKNRRLEISDFELDFDFDYSDRKQNSQARTLDRRNKRREKNSRYDFA